jgi:PAS domain S-box-containing protein
MSLPTDHPISHFEAVCENATAALFVMDADQRCAYMNQAAVELTGYTLEEVQGKPLHEVIHHSHRDGSPYRLADCPIDRAAPQDNQERGEEVFVHKDGSFYPVAFTASPIRSGGEVIGTVVEVRDIRAQKQREMESDAMREIAGLMLGEHRLENIVQAVTDTATRLTGAQFGAFFYNVVNTDGESYTLYTLSGVPREAFAGFPMPRATPLFGPTFRGEATVRVTDVHSDSRYGHWGPHHGMPQGHPPVRSYLAVPVASDEGEVLGGLFFGHERAGVFTAEHERLVESLATQAAIGISRAKLFLAAEVARDRAEAAAREKDRLYQEAARANQIKDQFLATVSHELRTPLTSILGWSEMLASGKLPQDMLSKAFATIARNARAQAQIIDDLLDVSRIVSGKLQLHVQAIDPAQPIEASIESVRPAALAKNIALGLHVAPDVGRVSADGDRLQQIAWNLLSNAVKFTPRGGRVDVRVARVASHVEIRIADTGRGIEPEFLPCVFDRFSQRDASSTREHGGLGLGLSIVRQLVEMHGGTVSVSSEGPGRGAEFIVRLPVAALQSGGASAPAASATDAGSGGPVAAAVAHTDLQGCRVLLVEDDADSRALLRSVLESHGAMVVACESATEALGIAAGYQPGVVVSDIGMPRLDGYEFIKALRRQEAASGSPPVPALALTAYARAEDRMRALAAGFQLHVAKPVQPAELVSVVGSLRGWQPGVPSKAGVVA